MRPYLSPDIHAFSHWMALVKVILEPGDPFVDAVANAGILKPMIGMFLLMGIILSNAYKGTNVYNMIAPRQNVPHRYWHDILIQIYASLRTYTGYFVIEPLYDFKNKLDNVESIRTPTNSGNERWFALSDLASDFLSLTQKLIGLFRDTTVVKSMITRSEMKTSEVLKKAVLHPTVLSLFDEILKNKKNYENTA